VISGALERPCGFLARYEQFPTVPVKSFKNLTVVIDISSSRDLYFLTMVGWANRHKEANSTTTAKKKTLIFKQRSCGTISKG
jgi:hypothetical protein